jgi:hypothetical protein
MIQDQKYRHTPKIYRISPSFWYGSATENFINNGHRTTTILRIFSGIRMYDGILCQKVSFLKGGGSNLKKIAFHNRIGRIRRKQFWKYGRIIFSFLFCLSYQVSLFRLLF